MTDSTGPEQLLARLDDIGVALLRSGHALALIGLGSAGLERHRLDQYSDLDFFVIVEPAHKALSTDGVFCEFAVVEQPGNEHRPQCGLVHVGPDEYQFLPAVTPFAVRLPGNASAVGFVVGPVGRIDRAPPEPGGAVPARTARLRP